MITEKICPKTQLYGALEHFELEEMKTHEQKRLRRPKR